jgi:hypothetical protein
MARFEIVAHVVRDIECESFEEAVTIVKDQLGAEPNSPDSLLHLVVWQQEPSPTSSVLPPYLRQKLTDFFSSVARRIAEDEEAFRGRMEVMVGPAPSLPGSKAAG